MIFEKMIIGLFKVFIYTYYKRKYNLGSSLRFNGYFIRIHGDGEIKTKGNSYISFFSYINVTEGTKLTIGQDVSIAHNVKIYTSGIDTMHLIVNSKKKMIKGNVSIGNNVLIGSNTFICPSVCIGNNVVIGANSVVTKDIPHNCVVAGTPAKIIKTYNNSK